MVFSFDNEGMRRDLRSLLNDLSHACHNESLASGWYSGVDMSQVGDYFIGTQVALIHSEVSELLDAYRKGRDDDFDFELADIILRCLDLAGFLNIDLGRALLLKVDKNRTRGFKHGYRKF